MYFTRRTASSGPWTAGTARQSISCYPVPTPGAEPAATVTEYAARHGLALVPAAPASAEVVALRRKYLDLTAQLCQLSGRAYTGKLENTDYEAALTAAATNPAAGVIAASLVYIRTCLRELCGPTWWDQITGL